MDSRIARAETLPGFKSRFIELASEIRAIHKDEMLGEEVAILSRTGWVEIVLAYDCNQQIPLRVEVEISPSDLNFRCEEQYELPKTMITHMEYLLDLMDLGFELQLADECYWIASRHFEEAPKQEILEALIPPLVK